VEGPAALLDNVERPTAAGGGCGGTDGSSWREWRGLRDFLMMWRGGDSKWRGWRLMVEERKENFKI